MEFVVLLIAWFIASKIFSEVVPVLFAGLGYLLAYLLLAFWVALKFLLRGIIKALVWSVILAWRGVKIACVFGYFLADEWWRGSQTEESEEAPAEEEPVHDTQKDDFEKACAALGLAGTFSKAELISAFRAAIKKVHSDHGGSDEAARTVITARDLLMRKHGWA